MTKFGSALAVWERTRDTMHYQGAFGTSGGIGWVNEKLVAVRSKYFQFALYFSFANLCVLALACPHARVCTARSGVCYPHWLYIWGATLWICVSYLHLEIIFGPYLAHECEEIHANISKNKCRTSNIMFRFLHSTSHQYKQLNMSTIIIWHRAMQIAYA